MYISNVKGDKILCQPIKYLVLLLHKYQTLFVEITKIKDLTND